MSATEPAQSVRGRYSVVAIVLHWAIAALILLQIVLATRMEGRSPEAFAVMQLHKSVGITVLLLSLLRLAWRLANRPPALPAEMPRWEKLLAHVAHVGFYVIMIGMPLTGWIMVSTSRFSFPTLLFGLAPWPHIPGLAGLTGEARSAWHEIGEVGHAAGVLAFLALLLLHVAGALKHQFIARDTVLARMIPAAKAGRRLEPWLLVVVLAAVAVVAFGSAFQPPLAGAASPPAAAAPQEEPEAIAPAEPTVPAAPAAAAAPPAPATAAPEPEAAPVAWKIDPASSLTFETSWGGAAIGGRFTKWTGEVLFSPEALDRSKVKIVIDMTGVDSGDAQRDSSLTSGDFFDVSSHPTATFTATRFDKVSDERFVARGTLSLRGVSKPLSLPFRLQIDGDKARVRGVTSLERTAFGVGQGEWASTDQIPAKVTVRVDLKATR